MKRALLALVIVMLFVEHIREPTHQSSEPPVPAGFPQPVDRATAPELRASALLLPLEPAADGFTLTSPAQGVSFDIDGDGVEEMVAWPSASANVAFLARDVNGDGRITSGKELFGSATVTGARNGCDALLRVFESSGAPSAGAVTGGDGLYEQLLLWVDRNHDGRSDPAELTPVRERFTAIGMGYFRVGWADIRGNRIRFQGWMHVRTEGPLQGAATDAADEARRLRRYFEVGLQTMTH